MKVINLAKKFNLFSEQWTPKIAGELNEQYLKLAKLQGEFLWHSHEHEDELFMVIKGTLMIEFRDRTETIREGEVIIVPKGVEHRPYTGAQEVHVLLIEPKATKHTGEVESERTVKELEWI